MSISWIGGKRSGLRIESNVKRQRKYFNEAKRMQSCSLLEPISLSVEPIPRRQSLARINHSHQTVIKFPDGKDDMFAARKQRLLREPSWICTPEQNQNELANPTTLSKQKHTASSSSVSRTTPFRQDDSFEPLSTAALSPTLPRRVVDADDNSTSVDSRRHRVHGKVPQEVAGQSFCASCPEDAVDMDDRNEWHRFISEWKNKSSEGDPAEELSFFRE